ncbi:hypothetical protein [Methylobacterium oxalidis]|uniref:Secreted protein n=1 Tax=Methylobacterium oxalidis TaxID=944322 RepID=A0A512JCE5_9HYPH|nr:hypothetical protein [Methylobacterium oxalidis]GEP07640.1 hypothetical protein MOX02_56780 [Methylobacterium oxalidis]GJE35722.1 hypothetical protein LDDCCGHA_5942 [Methylobacterium oxalidis]GLS63940.1 hypothetical protein GCM10007888_23210 [Methylobacterium oxalidis]
MTRALLPACLAAAALLAGAGTAASVESRSSEITFACDFLGRCPVQASPGAPDRDVQPFEGSLGRPCGWRWRETPSGTRKVRVCY